MNSDDVSTDKQYVYTEKYKSWEVVTPGQVVCAYEPRQGWVYYETTMPGDGCWYNKCANRYAYALTNQHCKHGHASNNTWASGYPACPHGYAGGGSTSRYAHCQYDTEYYEPGYRAPCGRTTTKTEEHAHPHPL